MRAFGLFFRSSSSLVARQQSRRATCFSASPVVKVTHSDTVLKANMAMLQAANLALANTIFSHHGMFFHSRSAAVWVCIMFKHHS